MKCLLLLVTTLTLGTAAAQRVATTDSPTELITSAALDSTSIDDVAVLDRATGVLSIGIWNGASMTWTSTSAGLNGADWLTAANVISGPGTPMTLVALSAAWQQAELYTPFTNQRHVMANLGIQPSGIAFVNAAGDVLADPVVASSSILTNGPELTLFMSTGAGQTNFMAAANPLPPVLRYGNRVQTTIGEAVSFLSDHALQIWRPSGPTLFKDAELSGLNPASRAAVGRFGFAGVESFVIFTLGATNFQHVMQEAGGQFGTPQSWSAGIALGRLLAVSSPEFTANDWLLAISQDGSAARLFNFTPASGPVLRQSFTSPAGTSFTTAIPQGNGHFLLLNGTGGTTSGWQRATFNGTSHSLSANALLPAVRRSASAATLFLFNAEPWATPGAQLVAVQDYGDWTSAASLTNVNYLTDSGVPAGLGNPASTPFTFGGAGSFLQPNQARSDVSLAMLGADRSAPRPEIVLSPPPGSYPPPSATVNGVTIPIPRSISLTSLRPASAIQWRLNAGPWQTYDAEKPPLLTTNSLLEAFAADPTGRPAGPVASGTYSFGPLPTLATQSFTDTDGNGLSDAWEKTFALHDPNADKDGDGYTNLQEQNGGSDPCDPLSIPGPPIDPGSPILTIASVNGNNATLLLTGKPGINHRIQKSADLALPNSWTTYGPDVILPANGQHEFLIIITPGAREFYRAVANP